MTWYLCSVELLTLERSYLADQSFALATLQMLVSVAPPLIQQRIDVDDDPNKTILHVVCMNIHNVPDSFRIMQLLLQSHPEAASLPMLAEDNELPLHWLCMSNPKPRVLRLLLDAYPQAAITANDNGMIPIHTFVSKCRCPESLKVLLEAAPTCMQISSIHGVYPLHIAASRLAHGGRIPEEYLVPLLQACKGRIWLDNCHRKSKEARMHVLGMLRKWVVGDTNCKHGSIVREMCAIDIGGCGLGDELVTVLKDMLPHCDALTLLDLSANALTREHMECLLPVVLRMPKLQRLILDDNLSEGEDVAIILSMISAPQLEVSIRCKLNENIVEDLKSIQWQPDEAESPDEYHSEDDSGSCDSSEEECATGESNCDENAAEENDNDSGDSGWVTDEEDCVNTCSPNRIAQTGGNSSYPVDIEPLQRLFDELEISLHNSQPESSLIGRFEGVYDSDVDHVSVSQICGDEVESDTESECDRVFMNVNRDRLIESSLDCLKLMSAKNASLDLDVNFEGEDGVDQGGLTKTYLTMVNFCAIQFAFIRLSIA
jgi:hypothetical protein